MRGKDERRDTGTGWPERAGRDRPDEPATVAGAGIEPDVEVEPAADLVRILSDLDAREERLRAEIASLEDTQRQLASGAQGREAALDQARRRADALGILAGTLPAQGPGLQIRFTAGGEPVRAATVLDAVEELRGAGAEAM